MATTMQPAPITGGPSIPYNTVSCATRLCRRCQRIPFDDGKYGGFADSSHAGSEYLKLDDDDEIKTLDVDFELVDSWPDLDILSISAETCGFCKLLRLGLKDLGTKYFERGWISVELAYHWRDTYGSPPPENSYALLGLGALVLGKGDQNEEFEIITRLRFTIDAVNGPCQRWLRLQTTPPMGYLCEENISRVTALLKESDVTQETTFFPTRVLDLEYLSKEGETASRWVRLISKEEVLRKVTDVPPYVALSYCWAPIEQASTQSTTTNSNIRERMMSIDLQTVSMVIQDAVIVCRALRIRYLWVDALCIIQGDIHDWERESSIMGELFRNAYFTIGAACSDSCHDSFLAKSLPTIEFPFSSSVNPGAKGAYRVVARGESQIPICASNEFEDITGSWFDRGWVFQEKFLSRRLLMFGGNTLHAEFGEASSLMQRMACTSLTYDSWRQLVCVYSDSQLTFEKDRLPAISGLASLYAEALGDQYLAGMWREDLHISLFWQIIPKHLSLPALIESLEAPQPYTAPSWSWARQDSYVENGIGFGVNFWLQQLANIRPRFNLIESRCATIGLNSFGEILEGFITISAKISALKFELEDTKIGPCYKVYHINGMHIADICLDWWNDGAIGPHELLLVLLGSCHDSYAEPCNCRYEISSLKASEEPMLDEDEDKVQDELFGEETAVGSQEVSSGWQKHSEKADDNSFSEEEQDGSDESTGSDEEDTETAGSDGDQFCYECFTAPENQCAYGLVLCPAKTAGQYYRVGLFVSEARRHTPHGGLKFCEAWETETITVI